MGCVPGSHRFFGMDMDMGVIVSINKPEAGVACESYGGGDKQK